MASPLRARPLDGRTIVVTRAAAQARRFVDLLQAGGARVIEMPTIVIEPPSSWEPFDTAVDEIDTFAWAIFTSVNGVTMADRRLGNRRIPWSSFGRLRLAAIGPATAEALVEHGVRVEVVPREYRAEGLVRALARLVRPGERLLLPRAAQTRDVLVTELARIGAAVVEVPVYTTRRVDAGSGRLRTALAAGSVDAITLTSSSTARNFAELFTDEERRRWLANVTVASIGPITAATAAEYGLSTHVMPREYTIPALARAIEDYFARTAPLPQRSRRASPTQRS